MVKSPLVLALESRYEMRKIIIFDFNVREIRGIEIGGDFAETANSGDIFIFYGGSRLLKVYFFCLFF